MCFLGNVPGSLLTVVNLVIVPFNLHRAVILFTVQVYIISTLLYYYLYLPLFISLNTS